MVSTSIQSWAIASVVFIFLALFAGAIVTRTVINYDIPIDATVQNLSAFSQYQDDLETYSTSSEDTTEDPEVGDADGEYLGSALGTITTLATIRSQIFSMVGTTQTFFEKWIPSIVWQMILTIIGLLFVFILATALWRYSEGIRK